MNQIQKLSYVDAKLGAPTSGQQTTRTLFDTNAATTLGQSYFEFFKNFSGKSALETNLTTNRLDSMESMVIKSVFLSCEAGGTFDSHVLLNIYVGNQNVIKDLDISFNTTARGLSYDRLHSGIVDSRRTEIRFLTDIVIPPQVNFYATLQLSTTNLGVGQKIMTEFRGYGKIFSAGNSF